MRKTIVAIVAAVAFLSTGCTIQIGDGGEATETPSASVSPETSESLTPEQTDEMFLSLVRENYPFTAGIADSDLIGLAKDACSMLDQGASVDDILAIIAGGTSDPEVSKAMGFTIGVGVGAYCPEHSDRISGSSTI